MSDKSRIQLSSNSKYNTGNSVVYYSYLSMQLAKIKFSTTVS